MEIGHINSVITVFRERLLPCHIWKSHATRERMLPYHIWKLDTLNRMQKLVIPVLYPNRLPPSKYRDHGVNVSNFHIWYGNILSLVACLK